MKSLRDVLLITFLMCLILPAVVASNNSAGFFLPDSVQQMTIRYRTVKGLIVLPVTINDSIQVNLILDTGCRNLVLFGKRFMKMFKMSGGRPIEFSGLGNGRPVTGKLSIGNKVSIKHVLGNQIPVVVVGSNNLFSQYHNVHGVIGYDIFLKFEIELNASAETVTFRPALKSSAPSGYTQVPLKIVDSRPVLHSEIFVNRKISRSLELMIDTGSSLGLLLKTTNIAEFEHFHDQRVLGVGLNGPVSGYKTISEKLTIRELEITDVSTGIVSSDWHDNASIGMDILKEYIVILNYCKAYACFKRNSA